MCQAEKSQRTRELTAVSLQRSDYIKGVKTSPGWWKDRFHIQGNLFFIVRPKSVKRRLIQDLLLNISPVMVEALKIQSRNRPTHVMVTAGSALTVVNAFNFFIGPSMIWLLQRRASML
jgi:hypothetical protein